MNGLSTSAKGAAPHVNDGDLADTRRFSPGCGIGRFIRQTFRLPAVRFPGRVRSTLGQWLGVTD